jgi:threonine aldolase
MTPLKKPIIDLRSDTVSKPTAPMRAAMYHADVGDNCFGDDRETRMLEDLAADYFGKPAGLFTIGGTQSNQIAIKTLTRPGDEILLHAGYHLNYFESAPTSAFSGVNFNLVHSDDGVFTVDACDRLYATKARWSSTYALPRVVVLENTVGACGGTVFPLDDLARVAEWGRRHGARIYLDGARLLHACVATGHTVREFTRHVDALAVCFSKALGAPAGSVLLGETAFIEEARRIRKWFGGDLHQSGILAAGARYGLSHHVQRLAEDHDNVAYLHRRIRHLPNVECIYRGTNILYVRTDRLHVSADVVRDALERRGVLCLAWDNRTLRFMSCLDVGRGDMVRAAEAIVDVLSLQATSAA